MPEVYVSTRDSVIEVILDRPPANALNSRVSQLIGDAFMRLRDDESLRVEVFSAAGERIFCAGWDLKETAKQDKYVPTVYGPGGFGGFTELFDLYKPIVCAVDGVAAGGGFELVLASDYIIAAEQAEFFLPDLQRGFLPDVGGVQLLARRVPYNVAMDLILTGRRMAVRLVPEGTGPRLQKHAFSLLARFASRC